MGHEGARGGSSSGKQRAQQSRAQVHPMPLVVCGGGTCRAGEGIKTGPVVYYWGASFHWTTRTAPNNPHCLKKFKPMLFLKKIAPWRCRKIRTILHT